jgi:hypothetical protein
MGKVSLALVVLKTRQVDSLRSFYRALGIELAEEQPRGRSISPGESVMWCSSSTHFPKTAPRRMQQPGWASSSKG